MRRSKLNSFAKWITVVEEQSALCSDVGRALNRRSDDGWSQTIAGGGHRAFEDRAPDAFLTPCVPRFELAIGIQASHLCAGSGPARGTIEGRARTEDKVAAGVCRVFGRAGELDVIDDGTAVTADAASIQRMPQRSRRRHQRAAMMKVQDEMMVG